MATVSAPTPKLDRYIVIHVATTCDEHGVYVTKDSAEVIELGWILLDTKTCEEVGSNFSESTTFCLFPLSPPPCASLFSFTLSVPRPPPLFVRLSLTWTFVLLSYIAKVFSSSPSTLPLRLFAVSGSFPF